MRLEYILITLIIFIVVLLAVIKMGSWIIPTFTQGLGNLTNILR